jgi:hypothetical protein
MMRQALVFGEPDCTPGDRTMGLKFRPMGV